MKQKHFYSHLIHIESLYIRLDLLEMTPEERQELLGIFESSVHHMILDVVLSELSEPDKKTFLSHVASEKHDDIWRFLKEKIKNIEEKIKSAVESLLKEFHEDIKEVKKKK